MTEDELSNTVTLGAAYPNIDIPYQSLENEIKKIFERKGEKIVLLNIDLLKAGRDFSEIHKKGIKSLTAETQRKSFAPLR